MLICETGGGLPNANSYADVPTAITYFASRNLERWTDALASEQSAALIRATDYLDASYVYRSVKLSETQALECPRYSDGGLDPRVVKACLELALIALDRDLFAVADDREIASEEVVGPAGIAEKTTYTRRATDDPYPAITRILNGIATRRGASSGKGAFSTRLVLP